ncbi:helix-turn-helix domain-containing protein [Turicibacter sanguinis]|nr:helix-turn-helix domain-containing protein [Turicibacter sanguinis]MTN49816.1 helix-turn-helix domain-containing protein [Turicibacter sanguinis]MTN52847.1 helix-turn-helix domain-containing protein [Turicibacter sanguinis]MTN56097.1 helix-turn-helix domain-containing protein [Turicibacter sanguinis]MTN59161.1 helix-turn-helix domain-containing protein [Turicibacter sanguinis]
MMGAQKENPIPIPQRFAVTLEEAGYLMGVSAQTISKYIKAGLIRPLRPNNNSVRVRVKDIEELSERMIGHVFDANEMVLKPIEVYGI